MSWQQTPVPAADTGEGPEPYLPVDEVARRLDLPLGILLRRVEAGDVPSRREEGPDGIHYLVRLGDLGIEPAVNGRDESIPAAHTEPPAVPDPVPGTMDVVGTPQPKAWPDKVVPPPDEELATEAQSSHAHGRSVDQGLVEPRREVAAMTSLDPRELVAGLLDRWERTLEQRIYSEQRQRFEAELNARQNLVKQLQLELQTARAEHAAAQSEKDRRLAERDRHIADLEGRTNTIRDASSQRRRWFFSR